METVSDPCLKCRYALYIRHKSREPVLESALVPTKRKFVLPALY